MPWGISDDHNELVFLVPGGQQLGGLYSGEASPSQEISFSKWKGRWGCFCPLSGGWSSPVPTLAFI